MNLSQLIQFLWTWWVTGGDISQYSSEVCASRFVQLILVIGVIDFCLGLIFSKKLRSYFF